MTEPGFFSSLLDHVLWFKRDGRGLFLVNHGAKNRAAGAIYACRKTY